MHHLNEHPVVPPIRIRDLNHRPVNPDGHFVLYWMTMARRVRWNFALQRAVDHSVALGKPLLVLEALRCGYPWASERIHRFLLDGMADNAQELASSPACYYPYVEPRQGAGRGLLKSLSARACVVVADWYPAFFLPRMISAAAAKVTTAFEAVDSNGLLPLAAADRAFPVARSHRAFVQRALREHLASFPDEKPLARLRGVPELTGPPATIVRRWPPASSSLLEGTGPELARLPIDHEVGPVDLRGGHRAATKRLGQFVTRQLARYAEDHNHPDLEGTSRLSPYLHFGHISAHQIFAAVMAQERWTTRKLGGRNGGKREGWWGVSVGAESYLDELIVWRELAFNTAEHLQDFASYATLPEWARRTLEKHAGDRRPHRYTLGQLDAAATDDEVWNAAQRQMKAEGWFHGYLRMLWGKKILEWSDTPAEALERMAALMNRYSIDGRDPNSYAGFAWVLGRYDRPWPERPIFGSVRYMTSASARRKLRMKKFLQTYGDTTQPSAARSTNRSSVQRTPR